MKRTRQLALATGCLTLAALTLSASAAVIDSTDKYAWGTHIGWVNFNPTLGNVDVTDTAVTGTAWSFAYGGINLAPSKAGVLNACHGDLTGYGWSWTLGWVNFTDTLIDANGYFQGQAIIP